METFHNFAEGKLEKMLGDSGAVRFRDCMKKCGVCHFLIAFRDKGEGSDYTVFDFGPTGLDVAFTNKGQGLVPVTEAEYPNKPKKSKAVVGEIREVSLSSLPKDTVCLGTTGMTMDEIRQFVKEQPIWYELHLNDCRHFVNKIAKASTGVERASLTVGRHVLRGWSEEGSVMSMFSPWEVGVLLTDYQNWPWVKQYTKTIAALLAAISGTRIGFPMLNLKPTQLAATPIATLAKASCKQLVQKPVRNTAITACATAVAAIHESGVMREAVRFGKKIGDGLKAIAGALEGATVGASAMLTNAGSNVMRNETIAYCVNSCTFPSASQFPVRNIMHIPKRKVTMASIGPSLPNLEFMSISNAELGLSVSKLYSLLKHVPSPVKLNTAFRGRAGRLARPA